MFFCIWFGWFFAKGYYESPLDFDKIDWLLDAIQKIENIMAFCFKNSKKDNIMSEEDEDNCRSINICRFCAKKREPDKVRDHCHLTSL